MLKTNSTYFKKCAGQVKHVCYADVAQGLPVSNLCFKGKTVVPCLHGTNYHLSTDCSNRIRTAEMTHMDPVVHATVLHTAPLRKAK